MASTNLVADAARWPRFVETAVSAGFRAVCSVPMRLRDEVIGALTLLNTQSVPIDAPSVELGQALADIATIGILQQRAAHRDAVIYEQLQVTLHHRTVIEQAKGVLAELGGLQMHEAYTVLRGYARAHAVCGCPTLPGMSPRASAILMSCSALPPTSPRPEIVERVGLTLSAASRPNR
ncbi:GAF and ANTAR domain-containing protein [Fodinicola feengrottensis]|uniref:GAF and ANTAR domain-containing protein n=1 Tax=Fodinicola feengrottensis TaxID=435914 RepID=UPI002441359F|nr:ANTAR domain-containing protein [Fodinicola feengrottensis]